MSSNQASNSYLATYQAAQYENDVLKAYEIVPMKGYPRFCGDYVDLKLNQTTLQPNEFALSGQKKPENRENRGRHSMNADETQSPFSMEHPSHCFYTEKERPQRTRVQYENDVLQAHGIVPRNWYFSSPVERS